MNRQSGIVGFMTEGTAPPGVPRHAEGSRARHRSTEAPRVTRELTVSPSSGGKAFTPCSAMGRLSTSGAIRPGDKRLLAEGLRRLSEQYGSSLRPRQLEKPEDSLRASRLNRRPLRQRRLNGARP
jgi:hypothetical protein